MSEMIIYKNNSGDIKVDVTDDWLAADYNAMVTDQKTRGAPAREDKRGSDCSGSDGDTSRVLTLANTSLTKAAIQIIVNGLFLHSADYSVSHLAASSTVTFTNKVWDNDYIVVVYFT